MPRVLRLAIEAVVGSHQNVVTLGFSLVYHPGLRLQCLRRQGIGAMWGRASSAPV
jgi:hypothetical protein